VTSAFGPGDSGRFVTCWELPSDCSFPVLDDGNSKGRTSDEGSSVRSPVCISARSTGVDTLSSLTPKTASRIMY